MVLKVQKNGIGGYMVTIKTGSHVHLRLEDPEGQLVATFGLSCLLEVAEELLN